MGAKKFYAVAVGRQPGIYDEWPAARAQVEGFPGARYKGFGSRNEAATWLKELPPVRRRSSARKRPEAATTDAAGMPPDGATVIYSDGGARFNPGPGGYGVIIIEDGTRHELSGGFRHTTNNRMELQGCIKGLLALKHSDRPVRIYTDSQYVVNGISKGWARNWRRRGWVKGDGQPALNPDLWGQLLDLLDGMKVTFHWVRGHAGHPENERCDEMAVAAAAGADLPVDTGYRAAGSAGA